MQATQLIEMGIMSAPTMQGCSVPPSPAVPESFDQAWEREIGTAKSGTTGQLPVALDGLPSIGVRERNGQERSGLSQDADAETKKSGGDATATKAEGATADLKNTPHNSLKFPEVDRQRGDAGTPQGAAMSLDGKMAKSKHKHAATAKSTDAAGGDAPKAEAQPGVAGPTGTKVPACEAAVVPSACVPVKPTVELASPELTADPTAALEKPQPRGSRAKQNASSALEQSRPAIADAKHETSQAREAINLGAPAIHANSELGSSASNGVPLSATATLAVPSCAMNRPVAVSARAETRLDGPKAMDRAGGNAPQVLASAPARLDVGVVDGTHGWLRIRAELGTGGAVNASLTASAGAHESLRAVLPEMASYLESEAVSVSRIAVHRAAAGSSAMGTAEGQQNGGAPRHGAAGEQAQNGGGPLNKNVPAMEQRETGPVATTMRDAADAWSAGGTHAMPGLGVGLEMMGGGIGGWLNVCA